MVFLSDLCVNSANFAVKIFHLPKSKVLTAKHAKESQSTQRRAIPEMAFLRDLCVNFANFAVKIF
jgi:hypothetical protein